MKDKRRRIFNLSLGFSLWVLLTVAGCVIVDYQGRRMSFGEENPPLEVERQPGGKAQLEVDVLGVEAQVDFTGPARALDLLRDFFCLPRDPQDMGENG
ncbi:MAG: hypothetical protein ACOYJZ_05760 [Acutalibacter sp.]|jgi:hypothetical protein